MCAFPEALIHLGTGCITFSEKLKKVISGITPATKICIRHKSMRRLLSGINIHYDGSCSVLAGLNAINLRRYALS